MHLVVIVLLFFLQIKENISFAEETFDTTIDYGHNFQNNDEILENKKKNDVLKLLEKNPDLPRLTRGEMEELIDKITIGGSDKPMIKTSNRMRALMLVLPFNSDKTDNLQELYNRPPITKVLETSIQQRKKLTNRTNIPIEKVLVGANSYKPTTYKPIFYPKFLEKSITITTYRPLISRFAVKNAEIQELNRKSTPEKYSSHYIAEKSNISQKIKSFEFEKKKMEIVEPKIELQVQKINHLGDGYVGTLDVSLKPLLSSVIKQDQNQVKNYNPKNYNGFKYISPNIRPDDYINFKPIDVKDNANIEPEVEKYLHKYRLLKEKPISLKKYPMHGQQFNISTNSRFKINRRIDADSEDTQNQTNSFNDTNFENYKQLQKLIQNIRELQKLNKTLHAQELHTTADIKLISGPNPNNLYDNPDINFNDKNDVKRQNDPKVESTKINLNSTLNSDEEFMKESTTEQINNDNSAENEEKLSNLEDSFGRLDNLDPITEEPLPPSKKNGFYFLADVNRFLEVGQDEDKVLVKFSQKIGDPSRFIPVKIPK